MSKWYNSVSWKVPDFTTLFSPLVRANPGISFASSYRMHCQLSPSLLLLTVSQNVRSETSEETLSDELVNLVKGLRVRVINLPAFHGPTAFFTLSWSWSPLTFLVCWNVQYQDFIFGYYKKKTVYMNDNQRNWSF